MSWPMMPEPQIKRLVSGFFARTIGNKVRQVAILRSIISEVYTQGYAAGLKKSKEVDHG